jgi:hypothetical protein
MSDSSVMMSESLIDKIDMTKFYDLTSVPTLFSCYIMFKDEPEKVSIAGFKRNNKNIEISVLCSQDITARLISNDTVISVHVEYEGKEIFKIDKEHTSKFSIDICHIQEAMCKVKLNVNF